VGDEPEPLYSRTAIPYFLAGNIGEDPVRIVRRHHCAQHDRSSRKVAGRVPDERARHVRTRFVIIREMVGAEDGDHVEVKDESERPASD
jgi:hypothetical protein